MHGVLLKTRLVGRERELADLDAAYETAAAGTFQCVLLLADPGVGKTRLVQEVLDRHDDRALGLWARGHPLRDTASFGLWAEAFERHLRDLPPEEVFDLCDGLPHDLAGILRSAAVLNGADADAGGADAARPRLLEGIGALVANLSARRPLIVVLDDIHQADPSSWDVLHYLAHRPVGEGVLVIAPARSGELGRQPVAMRVLLDLEQQNVLHRMALGPLSDAAVRELAEDFLGEHVDGSLQQLVAERSRGNPFFALGLLQALEQDAHALNGKPPQAVADGVRARVAALDGVGQDVLELLAVAGGRLELGELSRIGGRSLDELAPVLRDLVDARMIVEEPAGTKWAYEISHPLIEETISYDTGAARRLVIHREVGRSLLRDGRLGDAAQHFAQSADAGDDEAVAVLTEALGQADRRGAYGEGIKLLGVLGDILPAGAPQWSAIANALHNWMGDHRVDRDTGTASAALLKMDALPADCLDDRQRAAVKARLVTLLVYGNGELERGSEAAQDAVRLFEAAGTETEALLARIELAYVRGLAGDVPAWLRDMEQIVKRAEELGDAAVLEPALGAYGQACFTSGRFQDAEAAFLRAIAMARLGDEPYRVAHLLLKMGWSLGYHGRLADSLAAFEEAKAVDPLWRESSVLEMEACVRWLAGDLQGAVACADESALLGLSFRRGSALCVTALASTDADDLSAALRALEKGRQIYDGHRDWFHMTDHLRHAEGLFAWRDGRTDDALAHLRGGTSHLIEIGAPTLAAPLLVDLAELAAELGQPDAARDAADRLRAFATSSDSPLLDGMAALGESWALNAEGLSVPASAAANSAAATLGLGGYQLLYGRSLVALGQAQRSDPDEAIETLQTAAAVFNAAGAVWRRDRLLKELRALGTSGRRAAASALGADSLTRREWEVARLAVRRLSAQEIADLLVVSRRTVESHLAGIYLKLGVHSKDELIRTLAGRPG